MTKRSYNSRIVKLRTPGNYPIEVSGDVHESFTERLANMTITMDLSNKHFPVSTLTGKLRDQAELVGVINGLYELRMPLLGMEITNE